MPSYEAPVGSAVSAPTSRRLIVDAQVHLWQAESDDWKWVPGRIPHIADPLTIERVIPMMEEAGIDRIVVVPPSWVGARNDYGFEAVNRYPDRFAVVGRFPVDDPSSAAQFATWREQPGMKGVRVMFQGEQLAPLTDGRADWFWPAAEKASMPIMVYAPHRLADLARIAERHPGLPLILDHMGLQSPMATTGEIPRVIDDVVALAKFPNVSVKLSSVVKHSLQDYPYTDMDVPIQRCFDAFGPHRCHWGTDITISWSKATYRQRLEHFTRELSFLSEEDKDWVMGKSLMAKLNWA